jgi:hypothetical protein
MPTNARALRKVTLKAMQKRNLGVGRDSIMPQRFLGASSTLDYFNDWLLR